MYILLVGRYTWWQIDGMTQKSFFTVDWSTIVQDRWKKQIPYQVSNMSKNWYYNKMIRKERRSLMGPSSFEN